MRLNKYLAQAGIASRRAADRLIAAGEVRVNGLVVTAMGVDVGENDAVDIGGDPVSAPEAAIVYLLNKPKGVISSASDDKGRRTVVDLIRDRRRLYPVGRLDRDTTGALLVTNRGELTHKLTHPKYGVKRRYIAQVRGQLPREAAGNLKRGLRLADGMKVRASIKLLDRRGGMFLYELVLTEGQNREIKRIFKHYKLPLMHLHRAEFAGLHVDQLAEGKYRRLRPAEVAALSRLVAGGQRQHPA
ncbi:MAG: rRNA pseudouridine synthase [Candidatus Marinimicrobia bacterium]|nr:rRNA pseudouridine synthase [Candidatus Neomarinimicrobiota bacterium]